MNNIGKDPDSLRPFSRYITESIILHAGLFVVIMLAGLLPSERRITPGYQTVYIKDLNLDYEIKEESSKSEQAEPEQKDKDTVKEKISTSTAKKVASTKSAEPKSIDTKPEKSKAAKNIPDKSSKPTMTKGEAEDYREYTDLVVSKIYDNWDTTLVDISSKRRDPVVNFDIHKDGSVVNVILAQQSGSKELDATSIKAIKTVLLPPLPKSFKEPLMKVRFKFEYGRIEYKVKSDVEL